MSNQSEFEGLRLFIVGHIKKLNMGQLQEVVKYLMEEKYNDCRCPEGLHTGAECKKAYNLDIE